MLIYSFLAGLIKDWLINVMDHLPTLSLSRWYRNTAVLEKINKPTLVYNLFMLRLVVKQLIECTKFGMIFKLYSSSMYLHDSFVWDIIFTKRSFEFFLKRFSLNVANDWIPTQVLWYQKWLLCKLYHINFPRLKDCKTFLTNNRRLLIYNVKKFSIETTLIVHGTILICFYKIKNGVIYKIEQKSFLKCVQPF